MSKYIFLVFLAFILFSCNVGQSFDENFHDYYSSTFNEEIDSSNDLYIFLPMKGCTTCVPRIVEHLEKHKNPNRIHLIFVNHSKAIFNVTKKKLQNYDILLDKKLRAIDLELIDGSNPILIEYKDNKLIKSTKLIITENLKECIEIMNNYL